MRRRYNDADRPSAWDHIHDTTDEPLPMQYIEGSAVPRYSNNEYNREERKWDSSSQRYIEHYPRDMQEEREVHVLRSSPNPRDN